MRAGIVEDLIQRDTGEIGELHFDNRSHSLNRSPDRGSYNRIFANWRVQHASWKFFSETFCCFESASKRTAYVLPIDKHAFIVTEQSCLRLTDCFEIGDAHGFRWSISPTVQLLNRRPDVMLQRFNGSRRFVLSFNSFHVIDKVAC